jgi:serine/threonine protein kinase/Tfp pilus assembly protein PilF
MPLDIGTRLGRYEIRHLLGVGGMGEVYLAYDSLLQRPIALKVLPAEATIDRERIDRFMREAIAISALNHPNILTIYEIGQVEDLHFISTEYVEGKTLRERMTAEPIELASIITLAMEIASALGAAHRAGIVHRDIKPENVMLRNDGYVKVLDFGLAKLYETQIHDSSPEAETVQIVKTQPGMIMGTVSYMSPEQARGLEVDARSDIWSLGALLYEMISKRAPFDGPTTADVLAAILKVDPPPLRNFAPKTPQELQRIVKKALQKKQDERYQTVKDMLLDLKAFSRDLETGESRLESEDDNRSSIAILPFRNLTQDESMNFYEFSLADAVITELAQIKSLIVRPSSIIAKYQGREIDPREAGRELRVQAVLSAGFLRAGVKLRVTAQLLDVVSSDILWSDRVDAEGGDILALQDSIARRILEGLRLELSQHEQEKLERRATDNVQAWEEYLRGRDNFGRFIFRTLSVEDSNAAIQNFKNAIELDPKLALAYSGLGAVYANRVFKGLGEAKDYTYAEAAFRKAFFYDPNVVEARVLMVMIYMARGEKKKARSEIELLRKQFPNDAALYFVKGVMHRLDGEYDESLRSFEKLIRLDPAARAVAAYDRARIFIYRQDYEKALEELDKGVKAEPNHPMLKIFRSCVYYYQGKIQEAIDLISGVLDENPEMDGIRPLYAEYLGAAGRIDDAKAQLTEDALNLSRADHDMAYWVGGAYALMGEKDLAFKWLNRAIKLGNQNKPHFERDRNLDSLREDSRFQSLMNQIEYERKNTMDI